MTEEMKDDLRAVLDKAFRRGVDYGRATAKIDARGGVIMAFVIGASLGLIGGVGLTGWL